MNSQNPEDKGGSLPLNKKGLAPLDLDAMKLEGGGFAIPWWPCPIGEIKALHEGWWRALLDFILDHRQSIQRDSVLLGVSALITRTIPLVETTFALERAETLDMFLVGGPPDVAFLSGDDHNSEIPYNAEPDMKPIISARFPLIRSILSTSHFAPIWKMPLQFLRQEGKVVAHNNLLFEMAKGHSPSLVFRDAGTMFNRGRNLNKNEPVDEIAAELALSLANHLVASTNITEPYRSRLLALVNSKIFRILRITISDVEAMRHAKLPSIMWGNTGSQYAARAMAIEILRRGGETRFFTHSGTTGMVHSPVAIALGELAVSTTFVLETQALAEQEEMIEVCEIVAPLLKTSVMGAVGNKAIGNLPLNRSSHSRKKHPTVIYVGTPSRGFTRHGLVALPEVIILDWQFRLANFLNQLPINLVYKPHPGGYFSGLRHPVQNFARTEYIPFEDLMEQADVFVFDTCLTTTMWEAVCTDRRVVYIDMGMYKFHRAVEPIFRRRCDIIQVTYDENQRPCFNSDELETAILSNGPINPLEFQELLIGTRNIS